MQSGMFVKSVSHVKPELRDIGLDSCIGGTISIDMACGTPLRGPTILIDNTESAQEVYHWNIG